jgi:hypothetical protein
MAKAKLNKRKILQSLIELPRGSRREVYSREMKLLNDLISRYSEDFVQILKFEKKYDSIAIILCDSFKPELDKRFRNFNYLVDNSKYDSYTLTDQKYGEDHTVVLKPKTIRDFLNG